MQVIVCGCSWANGAELAAGEQAFGHLVSRTLGAECIHQAQDAASVAHMVLQLRSAISRMRPHTDTLALFLLTGTDRDLMWSRTRPIGTGHTKSDPPPYAHPRPIFLNASDPLHKDWFEQYHSRELASFRVNTSILSLQNICRHHGIEDYYAWSFDKIALWPEIDVGRFYQQAQHMMVDDQFRSVKINKNIMHPDQAQHQLMAQRFLDMIQNS